MPTTLRQRLSCEPMSLGLAACIVRTPEIVTVTRSCGFDCLLIDTEHGPIGIADAASLCITACEAGLPALVRVGGPTHPDLARVLDCGAQGVVVPHVETVDEARSIVAKCRFPPVGRRSLPSPLARLGFRVPPAAEMMSRIEDETLVVLMIESARGVANAAAIAAVPGVDVLMIGANDLAADLGHVGRVDHPAVLSAFAAVAQAAHAHDRVFSVIGVAEALLPSHAYALDARLVIATNDVNLLIDGGAATVTRLGPAG